MNHLSLGDDKALIINEKGFYEHMDVYTEMLLTPPKSYPVIIVMIYHGDGGVGYSKISVEWYTNNLKRQLNDIETFLNPPQGIPSQSLSAAPQNSDKKRWQ